MHELSQSLAKTIKLDTYYLIDCLICLALNLSVSTTATKISFLTMKIIKTKLHNKMQDEFLTDNLIIYIEKKIANNFYSNSIIDEFKNLKKRKTLP